MVLTQSKVVPAMLAFVVIAGGTFAFALRPVLSHAAPATPQVPSKSFTRQKPPAPVPGAEKPTATTAQDGGKSKTFVLGQVVSANGKPLPNTAVALVASVKLSRAEPFYGRRLKTLAEGKTDAEGRFKLVAGELSPTTHWGIYLVARAEGHGPIQKGIPLRQRIIPVKLELPKERVLRGRLVDLQGQPAAGVTVRLESARGKSPLGLPRSFSREFAPAGGRYLPAPVVSDAKGRFRLAELPADHALTLAIEGKGATFAPQFVTVSQDSAPEKEVTLALAPGRVLEGTVTYHDTGKPVANARLRILSLQGRLPRLAGQIHEVAARTDASGRYRVVPYEGSAYAIAAYPPAGEPYLLCAREFNWPRQTVLKHEVNLSLRRGVRVLGVVKEASSGKPVADAIVEVTPRRGNNPFYVKETQPRYTNLREVVTTDADGKFTMAILPGPSHLLVNTPTQDYVRTAIQARDLVGLMIFPNYWHYADGLIALDLKPDVKTQRVKVKLKRSVPLRGRVLDPDGKAVANGYLACRCNLPPVSSRGVPSSGGGMPLPPAIKEGRFELRGWNPNNPEPVYLLSPRLGLGGVLRIEKGEGDKEATIRLQPCGRAKLRLVDQKGKPLARAMVILILPVSPGVPAFEQTPRKLKNPDTAADLVFMGSFDRKTFSNLRTDADGRLELRGLIPGARHWILVARFRGPIVRLPLDLVPEAGKTLDLKDIAVPSSN